MCEAPKDSLLKHFFASRCVFVAAELKISPHSRFHADIFSESDIMSKKQKKLLIRIIVSLALFAAAFITERLTDFNKYIYLIIYIIPYLIAGWDVLYRSVRNILNGQVFDECFLMTVATVGAIVIGEYPESVFVMVFYQTGELFQSIAVGKSRRSIAALMDIRPETANVLRNGVEEEVFPDEVTTGETIIIRPGEKIPIDGVVSSGSAAIDTAALTGEAVPRDVSVGDKVISGCIDLTGVIEVVTSCEFGESAVSKILELVENSSMNKSKSENFITKFARVYTPAVVICAALLALIPSLITHNVTDWVYRALIFLVVSCPCALVISIPMAFFGGIGGASAKGILIKGANYLEAIGNASAVIFDKTGTLTDGRFRVTEIRPANGFSEEELLRLTAGAEYHSPHPLAVSIKSKCGETDLPESVEEISGFGVKAVINGKTVLTGGEKLMKSENAAYVPAKGGTAVYTAVNGVFAGSLTLTDTPKATSAQAIKELKALGVKRIVMLTGDGEQAAKAIGEKLGITEIHSSLLPQDKAEKTAELCDNKGKNETVVFVGDGINDAPVLSRADVGIAMGALGSDAAIEAADMVIMDDDLTKTATVIKTAKKTKGIVRQNVVFALAVKFGVLILAACGLTSMWIGVLADVGVAVIAILNSMRTLR